MTTKSTTTAKATKAPKIPGPSLASRMAALEDRLDKHQRAHDLAVNELWEWGKNLAKSNTDLHDIVIKIKEDLIKREDQLGMHARENDFAIQELIKVTKGLVETCREIDGKIQGLDNASKAGDSAIHALNRDVIDLQQAAVKAAEQLDHLREWEAAIVAKTAVYDAAVTDLTAVEEDCKRLWEQNTERVEELEQQKRTQVMLHRMHLKLRLTVLRTGKELQAHMARRWWKPWAKPAAGLPTKEEGSDGQ